MGAIRKLYVDLQVRSADAVKSLVAFGRTFQTVDKVVASAATSIERNADRVAQALARVSSGAAQVRAAGVGGTVGGAGPRAPRSTTQRAARPDNSDARRAGLADGSKAIREATAALGPLATKSDRAKAAVADLAAQVARNRREMADLRAEAVKNGDANGTLKARMQGLATATGQASVALQKARGELRAVDGGLIDAVKSAGKLRDRFGALQVAAGNLISGGVRAAFTGITGAVTDATKKAIDFESAFADVKKVLPDGTTAEQIKGVEKSVVDLSRRVAVDGPEGAAKLNAALLQTGLYTTESLIPAAEAAAKIGVAFDISAGEAGDALAKLRVGGNLTQEQVEKLAGTFNHLSNNMPATAKQIVEAEGRVISIGNAANIAAEQSTALVTAMIATGADADVAATGTKNFIRALASGEAATKKQSHAFKTLGLDARDVAKGLTAGGKSAEATVKDVVTRIGDLGKVSREKVLPVLIELFGSESISSIGPLATNIELLTKSFDLAGDSAAAAVSVEKEYESRSKTTANSIQLLKNNVSALAIEFGNQLLPYINQVVEFLTSDVGREWGRGAVEKAVGAVTTLASAVGSVAGFFADLSDKVGVATVALGGLGVALLSLVGPYGAVLAASTALGAYLANEGKNFVDSFNESTEQSFSNLKDVAIGLTDVDGALGVTGGILAQLGASVDANTRSWAGLMLSIFGTAAALQEFNDKEAARRGQTIEKGRSAEDVARRAARDTSEKSYAQRTQAAGIAANEAEGAQAARGISAGNKRSRFAELSRRVEKGEKLRPSEAKEYTALSKSLDEAKARKAGKGHKQTKMDRQLAAIGSDVRGVLTAGGETDAGGDLKVHDDALSRAVFDRATKGNGQGKDRSDGAGIGPGPNITTNNDNRQYATTVNVDARGRESSADNLRSAATEVASRVQYTFTGGAKLISQQNAGGVMRG